MCSSVMWVLSLFSLFFFSSRRRHTRSKRDWSSDVCSSDLERAQTLGRGRVFVGVTVNRLHFETLRGVSLTGVEMTFTHENVTGPQCDSILGTSCAPYGVPTLENDAIAVRLALHLDMTVTSFF